MNQEKRKLYAPKDERISPEVTIGKIGEHLVCADLMKHGYAAFLADKGCYYDVITEVDNRLLRVQVKTTRSMMKVPPSKRRKNCYERYQFWVRRYGKLNRKSYEMNDIDLLALVAIDTNIIGYRPPEKAKQCIFITGEQLEKMTLESTLE